MAAAGNSAEARMRLRTILALALMTGLGARGAQAVDYGGSVVVGDPLGALGRAASVAGGVGGHALWSTPSGALSLRLDGNFLLYGTETVRLPVPGTAGRLVREITTDNWIAQAGVGPQVILPTGAVRPYLNLFAGVSYLSTTSHLRDPSGFVSAESTNYDDTGFAWGGGGGFLVPLKGGTTSIDVGVRYVRTETMTFLAEGDLGDPAAGTGLSPHRGQANLLEFRLGVSFATHPRAPRH
jgi:hypothetical protein